MKRFILLIVGGLALAGTAYSSYPDETLRIAGLAVVAAERAWTSLEGNPTPVFLALGTFLLTVAYYKARGKSLRESVEVAATRVTVIPMAVPTAPHEPENTVVKRARARAIRTQLLADRIGLQTRQRKWPEEVNKAEKETCYTEQALAEAKRSLAERQKAHEQAVEKLKALRKQKNQGEAELAEIEVELERLSEVV